MSIINRTLGQNISSAMNVANLSRSDLAKLLSCSYREVCLILEGRNIITSKRLAKIAEILNIHKSQLADTSNHTNYPDMILDLIDDLILLREAVD